MNCHRNQRLGLVQVLWALLAFSLFVQAQEEPAESNSPPEAVIPAEPAAPSASPESGAVASPVAFPEAASAPETSGDLNDSGAGPESEEADATGVDSPRQPREGISGGPSRQGTTRTSPMGGSSSSTARFNSGRQGANPGLGGARGSRGLPIVAQEMVAQGDKDADKQLTSAEFANLADAWFDKLDPGKAGKVSQQQLVAQLAKLFAANSASAAAPTTGGAPAQGVSAEVLGPLLFSATDLNKDGALTRFEFKEAFARWFDLWDGKKSGKLDQAALRTGLEIALPRPGMNVRLGANAPRTRSVSTASASPSAPRPETKVQNSSHDAKAGNTHAAPHAVSNSREYSSFSLILEKNIFDSNRRGRGRASSEETKPAKVETITLVGTLVTENGVFAFFDGSSSQFRKVLEPGKTIASFKIAGISGSGATLQGTGSPIELRVGMQLRREDENDWSVVQGSGPPQISASSSATSSTNDSGADGDDDIVKRLMRQREQELK